MRLFKITFYVPESHVERVKEVLFSAGAGKVGDYDCCAWQVKGLGQFKPLAGSQPFIGHKDKVEKLSEYRVELVCLESYLKESITALKNAHPYEEPAFDVIEMFDVTRL